MDRNKMQVFTSKLQSEKITTCDQVELMRHIYNDNLEMLATVPLPYRNYEEQQKWWEDSKSDLTAYLYTENKSNEVIAFSVLTNRGNFVTPIIAIKKDYWGNGYGKEIIADYILKADGPLAGSQLQSNGVICYLNKKAGWEIVGQANQPTGMVDLLYHSGVNENKISEKIRLEIIDYLHKKYNL
jgi:hypothetical protein